MRNFPNISFECAKDTVSMVICKQKKPTDVWVLVNRNVIGLRVSILMDRIYVDPRIEYIELYKEKLVYGIMLMHFRIKPYTYVLKISEEINFSKGCSKDYSEFCSDNHLEETSHKSYLKFCEEFPEHYI